MPMADGTRAVGHGRGAISRARSLFVTVVPFFFGLGWFAAGAVVGGILMVTMPPTGASRRHRDEAAQEQCETQAGTNLFIAHPSFLTFLARAPKRGYCTKGQVFPVETCAIR